MTQLLPKHFVGITAKGVATIPDQQSAHTTVSLLQFGKQDALQVVKELQSSTQGLTDKESATRLQKYGNNEVAHEKPPAWWLQLIQSFSNSFILILVVLGIASLFTDVIVAAPGNRDWTKVIIISTMVLISSLLRFWQEFRSQKAAEKLEAMVQNRALVERRSWGEEDTTQSTDPNKREIRVSHIVPGDIVHLSAGDMVPADLRLLSSKDLSVSQSALTGEAMPVEKYAHPSEVSDMPAETPDKNNPLEFGTLCFMGTNVISGTAVGIVVATGDHTYFGSMARSVSGKKAMTSFDIGVKRVSLILIRFMLVMVPIVFILNGITKNNWQEAFFFALSVAVGLTPEMLPMIVTANLAKGAVKMSRQKVIVKKLNAIQNFGAMDILCTDKTGTLTENRVVLMRHLDPTGKESERVLSLAYLNSYFQTGLKSLMDSAIIEKMEKEYEYHDEQAYHKIDEIPFDFARRRLSVIVEKGAEHILVCKGAIAEILDQCSHVEENGHILPITDEVRTRVQNLTTELNQNGLRALGVAYKKVSERKHFYSVKDEGDLILSGYIGFLDPAKSSAKDALQHLAQHGVEVKVVTGDNEIVTARICQEVGLSGGKTLLGSQIEGMNDAELAKVAEETTIFARIDPLQKARIIEALKAVGHTVGYLGDGVNDAAALRESDVGVSVDTGVDIAKEAADIILLENDLLVLERGVMEGRLVFGNIMKYIKMTASSNFGNVFSVLIASAFLPFLPMQSIQLLIQNLLYDFSQTSLPWDTMDEEFLQKPRKWEAASIARFMILIGPTSSVFDITTFLLMWFVFSANSPAVQSLFQSGWFIEGLLTQTLIVHIIRTQKIPFIQSRATRPVLLLTGTIMVLGIILPFTAIGTHVGLQALPLSYFPWLIATLLCYCTLTQMVKTWYIRRFGRWL